MSIKVNYFLMSLYMICVGIFTAFPYSILTGMKQSSQVTKGAYLYATGSSNMTVFVVLIIVSCLICSLIFVPIFNKRSANYEIEFVPLLKISIIVFVIAIPLIILSYDNYTIIEKDKIIIDSFIGFDEDVYTYNSIQEAYIYFEGSYGYDEGMWYEEKNSFQLYFFDGKMIEIWGYNGYIPNGINIRNKIERSGGLVTTETWGDIKGYVDSKYGGKEAKNILKLME